MRVWLFFDGEEGGCVGEPRDERDRELATLQRAKLVARAASASAVQVAQGTYQFTAPLELSARDSGVRWVASDGAARLSGGAVLGPWVASSLGEGILHHFKERLTLEAKLDNLISEKKEKK